MTLPEQPQRPNPAPHEPGATESASAAAAVPPATNAAASAANLEGDPLANPDAAPIASLEGDPLANPEGDLLARLDLPVGQWQRVSPKFALIEIISATIGMLVVAGIAIAVWLFSDAIWPLIAGGAVVAAMLIGAMLLPRRCRSIGYMMREDDLLFRRGLMWQRFVAVPYGRMQLIDINRGPLVRAFGLAELKFVTAAVGTNVDIPGLPLEEAEALRDRLVAVAESRRSGL